MIHSILNLIEPPKKKKKLLTFPISRKEKRITQIIIYLIKYLSMQLRIWSREKKQQVLSESTYNIGGASSENG